MLMTNVIEVQVQGTYTTTGAGAKNVFNVFHYQRTAGPDPGPQAFADAFLTQVWAGIAAALPTAYVGVTALARYLDDATVQYVASTGAPATGSAGAGRLDGALAVVTPLRGSERGKNYRGSKHFSPVYATFVTNDELNAGGITAWTAAITNMATTVSTAGGGTFYPVVLSRLLSQLAINPTTIYASTVATVLLNKTIGTMRRRKEKTIR